MEITNNYTASATANQNTNKSEKNLLLENTSTSNVETKDDKPTGKIHDYLFKNADEKFVDSFNRLTANMPLMDASFMQTKVEVNLINHYKEKITEEVKSTLKDGEELTSEMRDKIFAKAKQKASSEGFAGVNINEFLNYSKQHTATNPLLGQSEGQFFTGLQTAYNAPILNSIG